MLLPLYSHSPNICFDPIRFFHLLRTIMFVLEMVRIPMTEVNQPIVVQHHPISVVVVSL